MVGQSLLATVRSAPTASAALGAWPRDNPGALYEAMRDAIVRLRYLPGAPIYEAALAAEAGVSRTPIRDALKRLRDEGLVEIRPGHGTFVARIDVSRLAEAIALRALLEGEAAARAAGAAHSGLVSMLQDIVAAQRRGLQRRQLDEVYRQDHRFHETLFEALGLRMMWAAVRVARAEMDRVHHIAAADIARPRAALAAHVAIVAAIGSGDGEAARASMMAHVDSNLRYLTEIARSHPDYLKARG